MAQTAGFAGPGVVTPDHPAKTARRLTPYTVALYEVCFILESKGVLAYDPHGTPMPGFATPCVTIAGRGFSVLDLVERRLASALHGPRIRGYFGQTE